ncbi:MAG: hypothetical protein IPL35_14995 [Sphingobacteriales bacterium]|nr:hypothetical protein [Sphingobacteriales bacterium]
MDVCGNFAHQVLLATLVAIDASWLLSIKYSVQGVLSLTPVSHYNRYSIWFAVGIGLLAAMTQYSLYKKASPALVLRSVGGQWRSML